MKKQELDVNLINSNIIADENYSFSDILKSVNLFGQLQPIIVKKSQNMIVRASHHGIEISDIMQEGFIALEEAIIKLIISINEENLDSTIYIVNYINNLSLSGDDLHNIS